MNAATDAADALPSWAIAVQALTQQIALLQAALGKLRQVQATGQGNALEIQAQISACERRIVAKLKERDVIINTRPALVPPSDATIAQLRNAVSNLQHANATAATIKAIVNQAFALADAVLHRPASPGTESLAFESELLQPAPVAADALPLRPGRYQGAAAQLSIDLRIGGDDGIVSADLFRLSADGQRTWVAALRSTPGAAISGSPMQLFLEDRHGAAAQGTLTLEPISSGSLHGTLFIERALDGLPLRREIAFAADFVGAGQRALGLEFEIETGVAGPPEVTHRDARMSIEIALSRAGIETHQVGRSDALPAAPPAGWSEKQIEALMVNTAQIDLAARSFSLQVLWLSRSNRPGLLGVMFDTEDERPRQSVAIFADAIRAHVTGDDVQRGRKLIQTAVHEIGHALNLAHRFEREVGRADSLSCMNYDWRYLGGNRASEYWNKFDYSFDEDELAFLRHAPYPAIVQGGATFHSVRYWHEGNSGYSPYVPETELPDLGLELLPPQNGTLFGFAQPVLLGLRLTNKSRAPLTIPTSLLDPKAGFVELLIRRVTRGRPASGASEAFLPIMARCFDLAQEITQTIQPDGTFEDNVNLTFGAAGFSFAEPGLYEVQALLVMYDRVRGVDRIAPSNVLTLDIQYPMGRDDHAVSDLVLTAEAGRWFALGAPERLDAVGNRLLGLAHDKAKSEQHRPLVGSILRTAMFGAARPRYKEKKGERLATAKPEQATRLAADLKKVGLEFLDPVSARQTGDFMDEMRGGRQAGKG